MKPYKAFLKKEVHDKVKVSSPILITESELDDLINGESIDKIDETGKQYKLYYSDLRMVISYEYNIEK